MNFFLQAGTQFWDENLENELTEGRLSSTAFDRYILEKRLKHVTAVIIQLTLSLLLSW